MINKKSFLALVFCCLIASGFNLLFSNFISYANAQANVACPAGTEHLTITKHVQDPQFFTTPEVLRNLQFTITLSPAPVPPGTTPGTQIYFQDQPREFCVTDNVPFTVTEDLNNFPAGFVFSTQYVTNPGSTSTTQCSGTAVVNQAITCIVTNTVTGPGAPGAIFGQSASGVPQSNQKTPQLISAQAAVGPTTSEAGFTGRLTNPPFQTCKGNTVEASTQLLTATGVSGKTGEQINTIVRAPSAGQYIIKGAVDLDKVRSAMNSLQTNSMTIELLSDLNNNDGVMTAVASPQFTGKVLITDDSGIKQQVINFGVDTVRTECKFITLAKAVGQPPNTNVAPLGSLPNLRNKNIQASAIDKLLIGGQKVTSSSGSSVQGDFPPVLNPPFATCQTTSSDPNVKSSLNPDTLALYNLKGDITDMSKVSGKSLTVEIVADLQQADTDLAKIVNNNNPFIKVNLISNADYHNVQQIPFTQTDLWTDCKQVSLTTKSVFQPLPGEIVP